MTTTPSYSTDLPAVLVSVHHALPTYSPPNKLLTKVLARPVSSSDQQAFVQSVFDPTHGVIQELEESLQVLNQAYAEATTFLDNPKFKSAKDTKKLTSLCHRLAAEVVEDL
eukprot:1154241-Pelagomonas_calceolata.AAC.5